MRRSDATAGLRLSDWVLAFAGRRWFNRRVTLMAARAGPWSRWGRETCKATTRSASRAKPRLIGGAARLVGPLGTDRILSHHSADVRFSPRRLHAVTIVLGNCEMGTLSVRGFGDGHNI